MADKIFNYWSIVDISSIQYINYMYGLVELDIYLYCDSYLLIGMTVILYNILNSKTFLLNNIYNKVLFIFLF